MEYKSSVEIVFSAYRREIDVVVDYEIIDDEICVNTISLEHEQDSRFQPVIDQINLCLDYEHLHSEIHRELKERKEEDEAEYYLSINDGSGGVFDDY